MQRIGLYAVNDFALLSYASIVEPLRAANLLAGRDLYDLVQFGAATSSGGMVAPADQDIGTVADIDVLFVVAGGDPITAPPGVAPWLRRLSRGGVILAGVSGGPVILAQAGLLAGRRMTLHWEYAPGLAESQPDLLIERSLYVVDRDRWTCAGGTAPLDMMHWMIARDHGPVFAQKVSDWFMQTEIRPSGGPQRAGLVARVGTTSAPVLAAVEAMEAHVADPLTLNDLAAVARVSARQLARLFQDRLGQSPMGYYRDLRLSVAARLITHSALSLTEIALATGFANSAHFAKTYRDKYGRAPSDGRR